MQKNNQPDFSRQSANAGSTLLVIGGCGDIGFAVVEQALSQGVNVLVMDLHDAGKRRNISKVTDFIGIDLRDESSIQAAFDQLSGTDIRFDSVVISSGYTLGLNPISMLDTASFDDVLAGNLRGPVIALKHCCGFLAKHASIVLLSTAIGQIGSAGYVAYGASKCGLNAIVRTLATELAPQHTVNGIAPGAVDTAFIRGGYTSESAQQGTPLRFDVDKYNKMIPLGRMANVDDIVGPILFLLSDSARYITGQVIHVNGGGLMRD